jgi:hypothetical protein
VEARGQALCVDFSSLSASPARCERVTLLIAKPHDLGLFAKSGHKILCSFQASYAIRQALSKVFFSFGFSMDCTGIFVPHAKIRARRGTNRRRRP